MSADTVLYAAAIDAAWEGTLDWEDDDIRCVALKDTYTPDADAHDFLDDVAASHRLGSAVSVPTRTFADRAAKCGAPQVTDAPDGEEVAQLLFYKHNASESAALLICCYSAFREAPLPTTGGTITFNLPAAGLFRFGS